MYIIPVDATVAVAAVQGSLKKRGVPAINFETYRTPDHTMEYYIIPDCIYITKAGISQKRVHNLRCLLEA